MIEKSRYTLNLLLEYLHTMGINPGDIKIVHSEQRDNDNLDDPRAFCSADIETKTINCSRALDYVSCQVRTGVLLHEIGHIFTGFGGEPINETKVDEWCKKIEPSYRYEDTVYRDPVLDETRDASFLEHVSMLFCEMIGAADA